MKQVFKIGFTKNDDFYNFNKTAKITLSEGIKECKRMFFNNDFESVCLGYDWGKEINIIFTIDKNNNGGILTTEGKLMINQ